MNNKNILALAVLAATSVTSVNVMAEGVGHGTATVTVKNTFDVTQDTPLSFGTIRATASALKTVDATAAEVAKQTASMIMSPVDGSFTAGPTAGGGSIAGLGNGTPAEFSMAKVGAYKNFTISVDPIELTKAGAEANDASFLISDFKFYITSITTPAEYDGSSVFLKSDADGNATFKVGATIATSTKLTDGQTNYDDMEYTGTYDVKVNYK